MLYKSLGLWIPDILKTLQTQLSATSTFALLWRKTNLYKCIFLMSKLSVKSRYVLEKNKKKYFQTNRAHQNQTVNQKWEASNFTKVFWFSNCPFPISTGNAPSNRNGDVITGSAKVVRRSKEQVRKIKKVWRKSGQRVRQHWSQSWKVLRWNVEIVK